MPKTPLALVRTAGFCLLLAGLAPFGDAFGRDLVLPATGEAATAQPMVVITLGDRPTRASTPSKNPLEDLGADLLAVAILDTGASGHVLSQGTAERFGVTAETGSRYVEAGMSTAIRTPTADPPAPGSARSPARAS